MTINIVEGREYQLKIGAISRSGSIPFHDYSPRTTRVRMLSTRVDEDGDAYVEAMNGGAYDHGDMSPRSSYVLPEYLEEVPSPVLDVRRGSRVRAVSNRMDGTAWDDFVGLVGTVEQRMFFEGSTCHVLFENGENRAAFIENLVVVDDTATPAVPVAPLRDRVVDAFKVGNVIQFTVRADFTHRYDETLVVVGCKEPSLAGVAESIVSMDKTTGMVTFEAEITSDDCGLGVHKHGEHIFLDEALDWFEDIKVVKQAAPKRPDVTLTLTADQAEMVLALVARTGFSAVPMRAIYSELKNTDGVRDVYHLQSVMGDVIPVINFVKG